MQSLDIYFTRYCISYESSDLSLDNSVVELSGLETDPIHNLSEILKELDLPRNTSLNLILDQNYIGYFCFRLPVVSRRKLSKILEYELTEFLIKDIDRYSYNYRLSKTKGVETAIGVYTIQKELIHRFIQIGKSYNLEIRSILPLVDLLDIRLCEQYNPLDEMIAFADPYQARIFVYRNGFLISSVNEPLLEYTGKDTGSETDEKKGTLLKNLNLKIRAIGLGENSISSIRIDEQSKSKIQINQQNELIIRQKSTDNDKNMIYSNLLNNFSKGRSSRINLLQSNFFILQEIRKHIKKAVGSAVILLLCCIIYVSSLLYENQTRKELYLGKEKTYFETIDKYLPKGTPKSSALQIIENRVLDLKETRKQKQRFIRREYQVSEQLAVLSRLKEQLPTLVMNRFYQTDQSIRIQGEIDSFSEYEQLKTNLNIIYNPKQYFVKYNQKSRGEGKVQFTVMVRPVD